MKTILTELRHNIVVFLKKKSIDAGWEIISIIWIEIQNSSSQQNTGTSMCTFYANLRHAFFLLNVLGLGNRLILASILFNWVGGGWENQEETSPPYLMWIEDYWISIVHLRNYFCEMLISPWEKEKLNITAPFPPLPITQ